MAGISVDRIAKTPGVCGGRACIDGHRIRVMDIVVWHEMRGCSPGEIVAMFPCIDLADVHAALAYDVGNRQEVEDEFRAEDEIARMLRSRYPSAVREKMGG